jgi:lipoprotein-anchoring transpeptidase ErfK/SrfK
MLRSDVQIVYEGRTLYTVSKPEIASWLSASVSAINGKLTPEVSTEKIQAFLDEKLPGHVDRSVTDEVVLMNKKGKVKITLQKGEDGRNVSDTSGFAEKIAEAVSGEKDIKLEPAFTIPKYGIKNVKDTGENWVEVNLTKQKVMLWTGDKKQETFTVSTGKQATPTVTGAYKIYMRRDDHTMIGGDKKKGTYYEQPHVRYISYFYRGYAFHAAYWHNAFGRVVSHGCVNMRTPEAKLLYDFAPIGTKVVVHH